MHCDENVILGIVYIPPESPRFFSTDEFEEMQSEISYKCNENKYVYLAGDTNGRVGAMRDFVISDPHLQNLFDIDGETQSQFHKYDENQ